MSEEKMQLICNGSPNFRVSEEYIAQELKAKRITLDDVKQYCWYVNIHTGLDLEHDMVDGKHYPFYVNHYLKWLDKEHSSQRSKEYISGQDFAKNRITGIQFRESKFMASLPFISGFLQVNGSWNNFDYVKVISVMEDWNKKFIHDYGVNNPNYPKSMCSWGFNPDTIYLDIWCHNKEDVDLVENYKQDILSSFERVKADEASCEVEKIYEGTYHIYHFRLWWD